MSVENIDMIRMSDSSGDNNEFYLDIDEILGNKKGRYFGAGFRRVKYDIHAAQVNAENSENIRLSIHYPTDWSSKKHGRVSFPHLSTVDAAYLASAMGEWFMCRIYEFDNTQPAIMQLLSCEIISGATLDEQLGNLSALIKESTNEKLKNKRSLFKSRSELTVQLGSMKINVVFAHSGKSKKQIAGVYGPFLNNPSYKYTQASNEVISGLTKMDIKHVNVNKNKKTAHANLIFESSHDGYRELSPVETVLASAQLAQALIYKVDGTNRSKSNTLWMRDFTIEQTQQFKVKHEQQISFHTLSHKRINNGGAIWSVFRFICFIGAIGTSFTFAHQLPNHQ